MEGIGGGGYCTPPGPAVILAGRRATHHHGDYRSVHPSSEQIARFRTLWQTLTTREQHTLLARCRGQTNGAIAAEGFVTAGTVSVHRTQALRKLRPVVSPDTHDHRGVLEVVCWHLGYEAALTHSGATPG